MEENRDIIRKADMKLSDLSSGGLLLSAQRDEFIRLAIDNSVALPLMSKVDMRSPKELREKIRYGSRALRKGTETVALPLAERAVPDTSKVELDAQLVKAETRLSYEVLQDTIEKGNFEETVKTTLAERISLDLEDLAFNGDTDSLVSLLSTLDGFIKQATTNTVAGGSATVSRSMLKDTLKTMPSEFRRDRRSLRFFTADEVSIDYHDAIGDRATSLGDTHVVEPESRPYSGIPLLGVPVFPTDLGGGSDETVILLTDPANMLFGIWRDMRIETDKDISAGVYIIVITSRIDFKFAHEPAVVKTTAVKAT